MVLAVLNDILGGMLEIDAVPVKKANWRRVGMSIAPKFEFSLIIPAIGGSCV
jgi:hypothetical protein